MNQETFLEALRQRLQALPQQERERCVEDYRGMIYDRMEDGATEEQAIAELGSPEEIAGQILEEVPLSTLVKERVRPKRSLRGWEIALLILGAPLWLPLLLAAAAVALSLGIAALAVVFAVFAAGVAIVLSGGLVLLRGAVLLQGEGDPLILAGMALTLAGLGVLLAIAGWKLGVRLVKGISALFRKCFLKNRNEQNKEEEKQ